MTPDAAGPGTPAAARVRVNGIVQGVGFRPTVWRLANERGLRGEVRNDGSGVEICLWGDERDITGLVDALSPTLPAVEDLDAVSPPLLTDAADEGRPTWLRPPATTTVTVCTPTAATTTTC